MATKILKCRDCGAEFPFCQGEQDSFAWLGFPDPIRCKTCRKDRRESRDKSSRQKVERRVSSFTRIGDLIQKHLGGTA